MVYSLFLQLINKSCDQKVILWLAQKMTSWKFVARWLQIDENEISRIEAENPKRVREQCYQMFLYWKEADPQNYTYPILGAVLQQVSLGLHAEFVEEVHRVEVESLVSSSCKSNS